MKKDEAIEAALIFDEKIRADNPIQTRAANFRFQLSHNGYSIVPNDITNPVKSSEVKA